MMSPTIASVIDGDASWSVVLAESLAALADLPDACVDAVITDPPYSSGGRTHGSRTRTTTSKYVSSGSRPRHADFSGDNRDQRSFGYWCTLWLSECLRVAKPGAPLCVFSDWRQLPVTTDAVQAGGWIWRGVAPWNNTAGCRPQRGRFAAQCEYVAWGSKGAMPLDRGVGCLPGVWSHYPNPRRKHHIAGKPIELMAEVVRICEPGGIVLDPFAGSGSTGVACIREGRRFIGIEAMTVHADVARSRLSEEALLAEHPRVDDVARHGEARP